MGDDWGIEPRGKRYRVRFKRNNQVYTVGTFDTVEDAQAARDEALAALSVGQVEGNGWTATGVLAGEQIDEDEVYERALGQWRQTVLTEIRRQSQEVRFASPFVVLVFLGDQHIGNPGTDYPRLFEEAELIAATPGMYPIIMGDVMDQFIMLWASHIRARTRFSIPDEVVLARRYLRLLAPKCPLVCGGNHDNWAEQLTGIDFFRDTVAALAGKVIYDKHVIKFDALAGSQRWPVKLRHKWRGSSIYNSTHSIERDAKWSHDFRIGVGAHTHRAGLARGFENAGDSGLAVLCGSYKRVDEYVDACGFAPHNQSTAVSVLLDGVNGSMTGFEDLDLAARVITSLS